MTTVIVFFSLHEKDPRKFRLVVKPDNCNCIEVQDTDAMGDMRWSEMTNMKPHIPYLMAAALLKAFDVLPPYAEFANGTARMLYPPGVWAEDRNVKINLGTITF